jgi:ferredoxin
MIIGRKIRNWLHLPALHLKADPEKCTQCNTCTTNCPMSLDVTGMVQRGKMENTECILCGNCVDGCTREAIRYSFDTTL